MDIFFGLLTLRVLGSVLIASMILLVYFSFDIYQFFAKTDFGNVNAYYILFTRHDNRADAGKKKDAVVFDLIGYKIPLRDICRNQFMFWVIIYYSRKATPEHPVLNFGKFEYVLKSARGRVSQIWASMLLKRAAGNPFREIHCQLALVYSPAEDGKGLVLRIILVPTQDIEMFENYALKPPINSRNFGLYLCIARAFRHKTGSFIPVRVTTA